MNHWQRAFSRWLVLCAFVGTVCVLALPPRPRSEMDQLLADYRSYGLPFPPLDARLVRFPHQKQPRDDDAPKDYLLGFQLASSGGVERSPVLVGSLYKVPTDWEAAGIVAVDPATEDLNGVGAELDAASHIMLNGGLATAIQCHARGCHDLARKLMAMSLAEPIGNVNWDRFHQAPDQPPRKALAAMAFAHWASELTKPVLGLAEILPRLRHVFAVNPQLDDESNRELLVSLEATLKSRHSTPGSIEALIDDLIEPAGLPSALDPSEDGINPYYLRLAEQGFDAVPALIAHFDDPRLTRRGGMNSFIPPTVGHFVLLALNALSAEQRIYSQGDAIEWWEQARPVGEEKYLLSHKSEEIWRTLARKYPQHIPDVYRNFLQAPSDYDHDSWLLAELVATCSIDQRLKIEVLEEAARHTLFVHRFTALSNLADLNAGRFVDLLLVELENAPTTFTGEFGDESPAARLAMLALETDDPRVWTALVNAATRAEVGLRMDFIRPDNCCGTGDRQRAQRIGFLVKFLEDETVRDVQANPEQYKGIYRGWGFPKLEVRNLAAMELSDLLDVNDTPQPGWTAGQWSQFRNRVQERLVAERAGDRK